MRVSHMRAIVATGLLVVAGPAWAAKGQPDVRGQAEAVRAVGGKVFDREGETKVAVLYTFDDLAVGQLPAKWMPKQNNPTKTLAAWAVAADSTAPSAPNVLSVNSENANETFNMILAEKDSFKDLDMQVKIRANTGKYDQGGGSIWRAKDEKNYYVCRVNPLESNCRVYKVEDGKHTQLQSAEAKTEAGKWYTLRVVAVGNHIECWLDDAKLLDIEDSTFADAGTIGLWTKADASSSFDSLMVFQPQNEPIGSQPAK